MLLRIFVFLKLILLLVKCNSFGVANNYSVSNRAGSIWNFPACWNTNRLHGNYLPYDDYNDQDMRQYDQIVLIGDVHGNYHGLIENLLNSKIIIKNTLNGCQWDKQRNSTVLLIQTGDVVDRGRYSTKCYECLKTLQMTASYINRDNRTMHNRVIRLIGNHELLWLSGDYTYRNSEHDNSKVIQKLVHQMLLDIQSKLLIGSISIVRRGISLLISHAGIRMNLLNSLMKQHPDLLKCDQESNGDVELLAQQLSKFINSIVIKDVKACLTHTYSYEALENNGFPIACGYTSFQHMIYSIGAERGGNKNQIGGVFWTDFGILSNDIMTQLNTTSKPDICMNFIQIVGHTVHMHKIVSTRNLIATCIDAGMMGGGRAYLEVDVNGRIYSHTKTTYPETGYQRWIKKDMTAKYCEF